MTAVPAWLQGQRFSPANPRRVGLWAVAVFLSVFLVYSQTGNPARYVPKFTPGKHLWQSAASQEPVVGLTAAQRQAQEEARVAYDVVQAKVKDFISQWVRPSGVEAIGHWPSYEDYEHRDYDPNRWEGFPEQHEIYTANGVKRLQENSAATPRNYLPYPDYNSPEWREDWKGTYVPCKGPRGRTLDNSDEDMVKAFPKLPEGFPEPAVGMANLSGDAGQFCFDRYNRYGAYGYGQDEWQSIFGWQRPISRPEWSNVRWGKLQDQCLLANKERYPPAARQMVNLLSGKELPKPLAYHHESTNTKKPRHKPRSAVLIRSYDSYQYSDDDLAYMRALITELSLLSGGEYHVFLLVEVKDKSADIWNDAQLRNEILVNSVPREFRDITILWSEQVMEEWYPRLTNWSEFYHRFMALQWFSETHPEFAYLWNWELDTRYFGNYYQFFESAAKYARHMPRKHLWERSQRFYIPSEHGTWGQFLESTDKAIEDSTQGSVWGPRPYDQEEILGPTPPTSAKRDNFEWGVGEDADLITFMPIFDPHSTEWAQKDKVWNYKVGIRPQFTWTDSLHDADYADVPMKACINSNARLSRRQLHAMHLENLRGRGMASEMFPATVALHHGLKAAFAPHPIWTDRKWEAGGKVARWSEESDSVWLHDREKNFWGWGFYYENAFARALYRRWLGWETRDAPGWLQGVGREEFEETGFEVDMVDESDGTVGEEEEEEEEQRLRVGGMGRMCLPPMLLHPVKHLREDAA
ncbi:Protein of unknown function (DUF3405) [Teratosphaeria destructans]|uniref:Uncharacterized protein n=1 Tax=Teratosphaeria destructans TaxID=418781 RepID=A0A9W7SP22_9PEZI|nr:Protein of unknown function (DUF3405) [Teratosphaeria destructans]